MKANELMIFDLVRRKKDNRTMIVVEVGYDENIGAITTDDRFYGDFEDYHETQVEPIPITPEILEKNGFKKHENDIYHIGPRYVLTGGVEDYLVIVMPEDPPVHGVKFLTEIHTNCIGKSGVNTLHNCDIECVHQLQHALRLCGIKKEISIC